MFLKCPKFRPNFNDIYRFHGRAKQRKSIKLLAFVATFWPSGLLPTFDQNSQLQTRRATDHCSGAFGWAYQPLPRATGTRRTTGPLNLNNLGGLFLHCRVSQIKTNHHRQWAKFWRLFPSTSSNGLPPAHHNPPETTCPAAISFLTSIMWPSCSRLISNSWLYSPLLVTWN